MDKEDRGYVAETQTRIEGHRINATIKSVNGAKDIEKNRKEKAGIEAISNWMKARGSDDGEKATALFIREMDDLENRKKIK